MALPAVLPEFILMHILVAARTIIKLDTGEFLEFGSVDGFDFMAFLAGDLLVFTVENKPGF